MHRIFFYQGNAVTRVRNSHKVIDLLERGLINITEDPTKADILVVEDPEDYNRGHRSDDTRNWVVVTNVRFPAGINTYIGTVSQAEGHIGRFFPTPVPVPVEA